MPSVSKQQQKFFGVVKSMQQGDTPKKGKAGKTAKSMTKKDVDDFASTKHKGLPKKVKREMKIRELIKKLVREIMSEEKLTEAKETPIDVAKRVVKNHQYEKYKGVMLDGFTASAIVQVYDKVNDATKKKLEKLPLPKLVNVVWKVMK